MGRHSTKIEPEVLFASEPNSRKRKRGDGTALEIEVDVNAPKPPSKKALRKAKKERAPAKAAGIEASASSTELHDKQVSNPQEIPSKRSEHSVWIGNLSWTTSRNELRDFLLTNMNIPDSSITRLHMPPPSKASSTTASSTPKTKLHNKGFAYVDFADRETLLKALELSEKLFSGRKVLIKDARSFEGRPNPSEKIDAARGNPGRNGHPACRRVFVGNLGFESTKEDLRQHFERCGEIEDLHVATFEDSGKCKGFAWIEFVEQAAADAVVRGWIEFVEPEDEDDEEDEKQRESDDKEKVDETGGNEAAITLAPEVSAAEPSAAKSEKSLRKKKRKHRKWWVNRFQGRTLRVEFAEGKDVRYKKRFGKNGTAVSNTSNRDVEVQPTDEERESRNAIEQAMALSKEKENAHGMQQRKQKVDARNVRPGAALAAAPRLTGGIVESQGQKIVFA